MATITTRRLNTDISSGAYNDPDFNSVLEDRDAVAQIIYTTLNFFQGEFWANLNAGTPLFQKILGVYGATANSVSTILQARIQSVPYVTSVSNVACKFDGTQKTFSFSADVQTQFGTVTVTYPQNGASAAIEAN